MHKRSICEAPLSGKTIHISSKSLWFVPDTCTHLPLHTHSCAHAALSVMSVFSLWDEWECLYEILTGHLLLCSSVWELDVGPMSVVPLWGHLPGCRHQGGFQEGAPVTRAGKPRKQHRPGDRYTRPDGWQSIKAPQPARSLYTPQGPLICKRCCLPSDPWGLAAVFVTLLRGCFQCRLCAIYVRLCRTAGFGHRALDKVPRIPLEGFSFPLKAAFLVWKISVSFTPIYYS